MDIREDELRRFKGGEAAAADNAACLYVQDLANGFFPVPEDAIISWPVRRIKPRSFYADSNSLPKNTSARVSVSPCSVAAD